MVAHILVAHIKRVASRGRRNVGSRRAIRHDPSCDPIALHIAPPTQPTMCRIFCVAHIVAHTKLLALLPCAVGNRTPHLRSARAAEETPLPLDCFEDDAGPWAKAGEPGDGKANADRKYVSLKQMSAQKRQAVAGEQADDDDADDDADDDDDDDGNDDGAGATPTHSSVRAYFFYRVVHSLQRCAATRRTRRKSWTAGPGVTSLVMLQTLPRPSRNPAGARRRVRSGRPRKDM